MTLGKLVPTLGKEIIAWTRTSNRNLLAAKPVKVNIAGLRYKPSSSMKTPVDTSSKAVRKAKYANQNTASISMSPSTLKTTQSLKSVDDIPIEECIEMQKLLTKTYRWGSANIPQELKNKYSFFTESPTDYLNAMEKLEQRIQNHLSHFNLISFNTAKVNSNLLSMYELLGNSEKKILNFAYTITGKNENEINLIINKFASKYGLSNLEQVRLARIVEARKIIQNGQLSRQNLQNIAYRIKEPEDLHLFSILEPDFVKQNKTTLRSLISKFNETNIHIPQQTTSGEIFKYAKLRNIQGHSVHITNVEDMHNVYGFFHTPESWGDAMLFGKPVKDDIYRRFANFRYTLGKPTNDMPVCYTFGGNGRYIAWADNGFFVNVPKGSIHAGGTCDLGSTAHDINGCIDKYILGDFVSSNNVGKLQKQGKTLSELIEMSKNSHNEFLCSNGQIQAFYTNDILTMDKAYLELAEKYNIPILNLNGKGIIN